MESYLFKVHESIKRKLLSNNHLEDCSFIHGQANFIAGDIHTRAFWSSCVTGVLESTDATISHRIATILTSLTVKTSKETGENGLSLHTENMILEN